jgi:hypothetical protein
MNPNGTVFTLVSRNWKPNFFKNLLAGSPQQISVFLTNDLLLFVKYMVITAHACPYSIHTVFLRNQFLWAIAKNNFYKNPMDPNRPRDS